MSGFRQNWRKILPKMSPYFITFLFPLLEFIALFVIRDKLDDKNVKDFIGAIYKGTEYKNCWTCCLFKPIMLLRRLLFIGLPLAFYNYEFF